VRTTRPAKIAFVSTYRPTVCGLASFTASLRTGIAANRPSSENLDVVRLVDARDRDLGPVSLPMVEDLRHGDPASLRRVIDLLNGYDAVSLQHEFGIFGGSDGREVLDLVSGLRVPTVVTFHTVLEQPSAHQHEIVVRLAAAVDRCVVMSPTGARRLAERYGVPRERIEVIPHGVDPRFGGASLASGVRPLALTWGLIGPGKQLETAIEAFAHLTDLDPLPRYLIAGATHPRVKASSGEAYRESLMAQVDELGLQDVVEFDSRYFDRESLARQVRTADLVVLPYGSREQVTSGVLVEAIAAGKPVVATAFPHSVEVLASGAGVAVPHASPEAFAGALRTVVGDPATTAAMAAEARRVSADWFWPAIGRRYEELTTRVIAERGGRMHRLPVPEQTHRVAG
jgi:polysaccharide biosynthesis protein PslF